MVLIIGLFLDQLTKKLAETLLSFYNPFWIIKPIFSLQLVHNFGAAYGILQNQQTFLLSVSIMVILFSCYFFIKCANSVWLKWSMVFLLIGALGNFSNRLFLGYVIDFIDIKIFPLFNLADISINIAILLFILDIIIGTRKEV